MTDKEFLDYCKDIEKWENISLKNNLSFSSPLNYLFEPGKGLRIEAVIGRYSPDYMSAWIYPDTIIRNITLGDVYDLVKSLNEGVRD